MPLSALAADTEIQRQLQLREQGQIELRLKMQQQNERAVQRPQSLGAQMRAQGIERDQQQRLRELHDQQLRATLPPAPAEDAARRDAERLQARERSAGELDSMGAHRRHDSAAGGADGRVR